MIILFAINLVKLELFDWYGFHNYVFFVRREYIHVQPAGNLIVIYLARTTRETEQTTPTKTRAESI